MSACFDERVDYAVNQLWVKRDKAEGEKAKQMHIIFWDAAIWENVLSILCLDLRRMNIREMNILEKV